MKVVAIYAIDLNKGIGYDNSLPWKITEELQLFKRETLNHSVVMGRKTFESINNTPLSGRNNFIISRNQEYVEEFNKNFDKVENKFKIKAFLSVEDLFSFLKKNKLNKKDDKVFIIGGKELIEYCYNKNYLDQIYESEINGKYLANVFLNLDKKDFELYETTYYIGFTYRKYEKINKSLCKRFLEQFKKNN